MSASNFATPKNVSCVYAVGFDKNGMPIDDDCFLDFIADDIDYLINKKVKEIRDKNLYYYDCRDDNEWDNNRSYPGHYIGHLTYELSFLTDIIITAKLKIVNGYYEGASLDYDLEYKDWYWEYDDFADLLDSIKCDPEAYNINMGLVAIHLHRLENKILEALSKMDSIIESVYREVSMPLYKAGQFSNGEAVYKECSI